MRPVRLPIWSFAFANTYPLEILRDSAQALTNYAGTSVYISFEWKCSARGRTLVEVIRARRRGRLIRGSAFMRRRKQFLYKAPAAAGSSLHFSNYLHSRALGTVAHSFVRPGKFQTETHWRIVQGPRWMRVAMAHFERESFTLEGR